MALFQSQLIIPIVCSASSITAIFLIFSGTKLKPGLQLKNAAISSLDTDEARNILLLFAQSAIHSNCSSVKRQSNDMGFLLSNFFLYPSSPLVEHLRNKSYS